MKVTNKHQHNRGGFNIKQIYNTTQLTLGDIYAEMKDKLSEAPSKVFEILSNNFAIGKFISREFHDSYYKDMGREHDFSLEATLNALLFMHLFKVPSNKFLIFMLAMFRELREFCGFTTKVPDESFLSKFKDIFAAEIHKLFDIMVTESVVICDKMNDSLPEDDKNKNLNGLLVYDTTGVEPVVKENNPKFINSEIKRQKQYAKYYKNKDYNVYAAAYKTLPKQSSANPAIKLDFVNAHFCYAYKIGLLTNGWGIPLAVNFFDEDFYEPFKDKEFSTPEEQKFSYDNASLIPVLNSFLQKHPAQFSSFAGDSEFDSYDNYSYLKNSGFTKVFIPINNRNSANTSKNGLKFDPQGQPLCPRDGTPFRDDGLCKGKNRSPRFKKICPKTTVVKGKYVNTCEQRCTDSPCGRMTYIYPEKDFRLFPGISRTSDEFIATYKGRTVIERTISGLKSNPCIAKPKSLKIKTIKSDIIFASISKLVTLFLAYSLKQPSYFKNFTKLLSVA